MKNIKMNSRAFTLMELLVTLGIIAFLVTALFVAVNQTFKSVKTNRAKELALQYATALNLISAKGGSWTGSLISAANMSDPILDTVACKSLAAIGVSLSRSGVNLTGRDRCGMADPWAQEVIDKTSVKVGKEALLAKGVESGGTVKDHLYRFAIAKDDENKVIAKVGSKNYVINGTRAVVWCFGADGVPNTDDDVYSWQHYDVESEKK